MAVAKRYYLRDIQGVTASYSASPASEAGIGQVVFALNCNAGSTCMGQCVAGSSLVPWGLCCIMYCNVNSACSSQSCTACGFCLCGSATFVALGSIIGCGATLWRRIS